MANVKNITKKLVSAGYSENKLMMMTEKEIREAYKTLKEESTMIKVVCKNKMDSKGNTSTSIKEYDSLEAAMKAAKDVAEAASVISVTVVGKDEIIVKEESNMDNTTLKVKRDYDDSFESWINKINNLLSSNGIHLDNDKLLTIIDDETDCVSVSIDSKDINVHGWCAGEPVDCCYDFHGNLKEYSDEGTNFEYVSVGEVEKEEYTMHVADKNIVVENNINKSIDKSSATIVFDDGLALKILEGVIRQADTNKVHNFISDWMLTSIISKLVLGYPLKDKGHEYYKSFTDDQRKVLVDMRKAFVKRAKLVAKYNSSKIAGYYIPAKVLIWGRHKYLGFACVYRFMSGNKVAAEYHVSLNGIKNIATGKITALDDAAYETLDSRCVFIM